MAYYRHLQAITKGYKKQNLGLLIRRPRVRFEPEIVLLTKVQTSCML